MLYERMGKRLLGESGTIDVVEGGKTVGYIVPTAEVVRRILEEELSAIYKKHRKDMQLETLCAVTATHGVLTLFCTKQNVVTEGHNECLGVGDSSVVRYLTTLLGSPAMDRRQGAMLGLYVMAQAKKYIKDCSGETDMVLLADGRIEHTDDLEGCLGLIELEVKKLMESMTNPQVTRPDFAEALRKFEKEMKRLRGSLLK